MASDVKVAVVYNDYDDSAQNDTDIDFDLPSGWGTPCGYILISGYPTDYTSTPSHFGVSIGMSDGTSQECQEINSEDAISPTDTHEASRADQGIDTINFLTGSNSVFNRMDDATTSFGTDKVTIHAHSSSTGDMGMDMIVFGGADCSCKVGYVTGGTNVNDTVDFTHNLGASNYLVFVLSNRATSTSDNNVNTSTIGLGVGRVAGGGTTIEQACAGWVTDGNSSTTDVAVGEMSPDAGTPVISTHPTPTGANYNLDQHQISAATTNKITFKKTKGTTASQLIKVMVVDIGDLDASVFGLDSFTSTSEWDQTSLVSFRPQAINVIQTYADQENTNSVGADADGFSFGWAADDGTSLKELLYGWAEYDGTSTPVVSGYRRKKLFYLETNTGGSGTTRWDASGITFSDGGFTVTPTTADGTTRYWVGWSLEDPAYAGGGAPSGLSLLGVGV